MRKSLSLALAASLLLGQVPARAMQNLRPVANPGAQAPGVAAQGASALPLSAPLSLAAPDLTPSAPLASSVLPLAPSADVPSALPSAAVTATAVEAVLENSAAMALPTAGAAAPVARDLSVHGAGRAATMEAKQPTDAPRASALAAAQELSSPDAAPEPVFDGARPAAGAEAEPVRPGLLSRWFGRIPLLGRLVREASADEAAEPPAPKTEFSPDEYGGPSYKGMTVRGRVLYGLKWGVNLLGISTLLHIVAKPLLSMFPWPLYLADPDLQTHGRAELISQLSPAQIAEAARANPLEFLFWDLPRMAAMEEVSHRLLYFGVAFVLLAALKPISAWALKGLEKVDDLFQLKALAVGAAELAGALSRRAFWVALGLSAFHFAAAHFPTWGVDPFFLLSHMTLGAALGYIAYRTRSLLVPFIAHYAHNLALVFMASVSPSLFGADRASTLSALAGLFVLIPLWYQWRAHRKDKAAALEQAIAARDEGVELEGRPQRRRPRALLESALLALLVVMPFSPFMYTAPQAQAPGAGGHPVVSVPAAPARPPAPGPAGLAALTAPAPPTAVEIAEHAKSATLMVIVEGSDGRAGSGSGFIIDKNGLAVTNAHVAGPAGLHGAVMVKLYNDMIVPAEVVALNKNLDIALLKLPPNLRGWPVVALGNGSLLREGQEAVAMGHPFGMPRTVTKGTISGVTGRGNDYIKNLIQHDVAINPGNSGGPLLTYEYDAASNSWKVVVIGINTMIRTNSGQWAGMGFAIDVRVLQETLAQYSATGTISPNWSGLIINMRDEEARSRGLRVEHVRPGSPAETAGLRRGDTILSVNGKALQGGQRPAIAQWRRALVNASPGRPAALTVSREDEVLTIVLTLGDEADKTRSLLNRVFGTPVMPPSLELNSFHLPR